MPDEVRLAMPANPEFLRLARVTAMGLASRVSFTIDDIEDLRIAIDELLLTVIGTNGRPGSVLLTYRLTDDGLEVVGRGQFDEATPSVRLTEFAELILGAVADEYEVGLDDGVPTFRLVKRRAG
ncbi:MAG: hypothetical protein ACR2H3_05875 [Acidimicrobiales bacterium]